MEDEDVYKAPDSDLVDSRSDRKRPAATMIILTPLIIFVNAMVSAVIGVENRIRDFDLLIYMAVMAGGVPALITFFIQQIEKFRNAKSRLNILFFVSLAIAGVQFAGVWLL